MKALFAIAVMWLAAVPVAGYLLRRLPDGGSHAFTAGSAFLIGAMLAAVSVPLSAALFGTIGWVALAGSFAVLAATGAVVARYATDTSETARAPHWFQVDSLRSPAGMAVTGAVAAWLGARFWLLLLEATSKPLLAWDAWELWAAKAKVWASQGELFAFHLPVAVGRNPIPEGYFASTKHPDLLPWLFTWFTTLSGGWDERVIGYLYVALVVALCLCIYGTVRVLTRSPVVAALAAAGLGTLPYLNAQVALPGYADIWVAAYFGYGAMLLCLFGRRPLDRSSLTLLVLAGVACVGLKSTGLIWAGVLFIGLVVAVRPGIRWITYAALAAVVAFIVLSSPGELWLPLKMRQWSLDFANVTDPLLRVLLAFRDWNILWWVVGAAILLRAVLPVKERSLHSLDVILVASATILATGFYYSELSFWVTKFTGVNRGLVPLAPVALLWAALSLERVSRRPSPRTVGRE